MTAKSKNMRKRWVDPDDAPELTDAFFERATPMIGNRVVTRAEYGAAVRRGRPKADVTKVAVKLRLDPDLLAVLKATGPGWQTRANRILRERFAL
ncbi:MAG: hypothetical protein OJF55_000787 [Rhodanobacteraceae bacterium]|jgi:uncharacterized protein (DUF4415 family)|nr:MAG: hypothetical protein OJF55_000787 [Rhodanobacteraceae bacterium]